MKRVRVILFCMVLMLCMVGGMTTGCETEASRVSTNVSNQADNFNVIRRLVVINLRTDKILFDLTAAFSIEVDSTDSQLEVVCETGPGEYKKHIIAINEWVFYDVEDISGANVSPYHYEVNFLPEMIVPFEVISKD